MTEPAALSKTPPRTTPSLFYTLESPEYEYNILRNIITTTMITEAKSSRSLENTLCNYRVAEYKNASKIVTIIKKMGISALSIDTLRMLLAALLKYSCNVYHTGIVFADPMNVKENLENLIKYFKENQHVKKYDEPIAYLKEQKWVKETPGTLTLTAESEVFESINKNIERKYSTLNDSTFKIYYGDMIFKKDNGEYYIDLVANIINTIDAFSKNSVNTIIDPLNRIVISSSQCALIKKRVRESSIKHNEFDERLRIMLYQLSNPTLATLPMENYDEIIKIVIETPITKLRTLVANTFDAYCNKVRLLGVLAKLNLDELKLLRIGLVVSSTSAHDCLSLVFDNRFEMYGRTTSEYLQEVLALNSPEYNGWCKSFAKIHEEIIEASRLKTFSILLSAISREYIKGEYMASKKQKAKEEETAKTEFDFELFYVFKSSFNKKLNRGSSREKIVYAADGSEWFTFHTTKNNIPISMLNNGKSRYGYYFYDNELAADEKYATLSQMDVPSIKSDAPEKKVETITVMIPEPDKSVERIEIADASKIDEAYKAKEAEKIRKKSIRSKTLVDEKKVAQLPDGEHDIYVVRNTYATRNDDLRHRHRKHLYLKKLTVTIADSVFLCEERKRRINIACVDCSPVRYTQAGAFFTSYDAAKAYLNKMGKKYGAIGADFTLFEDKEGKPIQIYGVRNNSKLAKKPGTNRSIELRPFTTTIVNGEFNNTFIPISAANTISVEYLNTQRDRRWWYYFTEKADAVKFMKKVANDNDLILLLNDDKPVEPKVPTRKSNNPAGAPVTMYAVYDGFTNTMETQFNRRISIMTKSGNVYDNGFRQTKGIPVPNKYINTYVPIRSIYYFTTYEPAKNLFDDLCKKFDTRGHNHIAAENIKNGCYTIYVVYDNRHWRASSEHTGVVMTKMFATVTDDNFIGKLYRHSVDESELSKTYLNSELGIRGYYYFTTKDAAIEFAKKYASKHSVIIIDRLDSDSDGATDAVNDTTASNIVVDPHTHNESNEWTTVSNSESSEYAEMCVPTTDNHHNELTDNSEPVETYSEIDDPNDSHQLVTDIDESGTQDDVPSIRVPKTKTFKFFKWQLTITFGKIK